jgi:TRAP-type C4-dicarboxylate transport system substrate-binding protein
MKNLKLFLVVLIVGICLSIGYTAPVAAEKKPIILKAAVALPYHPGSRFDIAVDVCKWITEKSKGELKVQFIGGAESMPPPHQVKAVMSGVLDIAWTFPTFYQRQIPETQCFSASELSAAEERASGFYNYINELHKKHGMIFLGRMRGDGFYWTSNKMVKDPRKDFKGQKLGVIGRFWNSFTEKLGAIPANVPIQERYTALERGVIDGIGVAGVGMAAMGHGEVVKYYFDHSFLKGGSAATIMNLKSFNRLPKHLQDLVTKEFIHFEEALPAYMKKKRDEEVRILKKQGMTFIKFSPADAEWYVSAAREAKWAEVKKTTSPETYAKLRELLKVN